MLIQKSTLSGCLQTIKCILILQIKSLVMRMAQWDWRFSLIVRLIWVHARGTRGLVDEDMQFYTTASGFAGKHVGGPHMQPTNKYRQELVTRSVPTTQLVTWWWDHWRYGEIKPWRAIRKWVAILVLCLWVFASSRCAFASPYSLLPSHKWNLTKKKGKRKEKRTAHQEKGWGTIISRFAKAQIKTIKTGIMVLSTLYSTCFYFQIG